MMGVYDRMYDAVVDAGRPRAAGRVELSSRKRGGGRGRGREIERGGFKPLQGGGPGSMECEGQKNKHRTGSKP